MIPTLPSVLVIAGQMVLLVVPCGREISSCPELQLRKGEQETQHSQKTLKGYTQPTVSFFLRTGTIKIFGVYVLCV